jgi:anaerobic magnesium-protoporphyrin IX monomethyl ester cyclase
LIKIKKKKHFTWHGLIRADSVDSETVSLMRDSGCIWCLLGVESGDKKILKNMEKHLDPEKVHNAVTLLDANEINTQSSFIVGFPRENAQSLKNTAELISSFPSGQGAKALHKYYLFHLQVQPLCPMSTGEQRRKFKLTGLFEKWAHNTMNSEEAIMAMKEIFLQVRGTTHVYPELHPCNWSVSETRQIMEIRDAIQKKSLRGHDIQDDVNALVRAVAQI